MSIVVNVKLQELLTIEFEELSSSYLFSDAKAAQLQAVFELAKRLTPATQGAVSDTLSCRRGSFREGDVILRP